MPPEVTPTPKLAPTPPLATLLPQSEMTLHPAVGCFDHHQGPNLDPYGQAIRAAVSGAATATLRGGAHHCARRTAKAIPRTDGLGRCPQDTRRPGYLLHPCVEVPPAAPRPSSQERVLGFLLLVIRSSRRGQACVTTRSNSANLRGGSWPTPPTPPGGATPFASPFAIEPRRSN